VEQSRVSGVSTVRQVLSDCTVKQSQTVNQYSQILSSEFLICFLVFCHFIRVPSLAPSKLPSRACSFFLAPPHTFLREASSRYRYLCSVVTAVYPAENIPRNPRKRNHGKRKASAFKGGRYRMPGDGYIRVHLLRHCGLQLMLFRQLPGTLRKMYAYNPIQLLIFITKSHMSRSLKTARDAELLSITTEMRSPWVQKM